MSPKSGPIRVKGQKVQSFLGLVQLIPQVLERSHFVVVVTVGAPFGLLIWTYTSVWGRSFSNAYDPHATTGFMRFHVFQI